MTEVRVAARGNQLVFKKLKEQVKRSRTPDQLFALALCFTL